MQASSLITNAVTLSEPVPHPDSGKFTVQRKRKKVEESEGMIGTEPSSLLGFFTLRLRSLGQQNQADR